MLTKMKVRVAKRMDPLFDRLARAFPGYRQTRDALGSVMIRGKDERLAKKLVRWLDSEQVEYYVGIIDYWTINELVRARWLAVRYTADSVDDDSNWDPINCYRSALCRKCHWFDEANVPTPYSVTNSVLRRKEDVFPAHNGVIIAREGVKDLLVEVVRDQR